MNFFGELIKRAREEKGLTLREVSSETDIDQAIISKIERGERKPTKKQVLKFTKFLQIEKEKLFVAWLADKIIHELKNEPLAVDALRLVVQTIQYKK